jgi:formylglycine-generating enzyme required for sulfatase activity
MARVTSMLLLALLSVAPSVSAQTDPAKEQARKRYEEEFFNERACATTYASEYRLVRAFILSMTGFLPEAEQKPAATPYFSRLAAGENPFAVYRDYKKSFQDNSNFFGGPPKEGWSIMDRYEKEHPDFSKTRIHCEISPVDYLAYRYLAYEKVEFPALSSKSPGGTIKVVLSNQYVERAMGGPEIDFWAFSIVDEHGGWEYTTNVGGGERPRGVEAVGDVVRPPAGPGSSTRRTAEKLGVQWVAIPGGTFMMGEDKTPWATGVHPVAVKSFQMSKTEVTNKQYKACVAAGACVAPFHEDASFEGDQQPVVSIDQNSAKAFAAWAGARLPTEAEWEYAARSAGKPRKYPWGDAPATCELAVIMDCAKAPLPVCSKPKGNTEQGLCDMAGNAWEWVADSYHETYKDAPTDGSVWEGTGGEGVERGGSWSQFADWAPTTARGHRGSKGRSLDVGFRIAR